jgi:hypothetical protein
MPIAAVLAVRRALPGAAPGLAHPETPASRLAPLWSTAQEASEGCRRPPRGCDPGRVTPAPTGTAEQKRAMREAAARRRAADLLRITSATLDYAAVQLSNGIGPQEARRSPVCCGG